MIAADGGNHFMYQLKHTLLPGASLDTSTAAPGSRAA